jgi:hypothetical protein
MIMPVNMTLYRLLVKQGATEADAEQAAKVDAAHLVTSIDLTAQLAELKASLLMWIITLLIAQTGLIFAVLRFVRP